MEESEKKIAQILIKARLITEELLRDAEQKKKKTGGRLTEVLTTLGVDAGTVRKALAERLNIPEAILRARPPHPDVIRLIPESWFQKYGIIPLERVGNILTLGMVNPFDNDIIKDIRFKTAISVRVAVISEAELPGWLELCYGTSTQRVDVDLDEILKDIGPQQVEILAQGQDPGEMDELQAENNESDGAVIRLVDRIIHDAVRARATDIHIEPMESNVLVRYRIDGVLADILKVPKYVQGPLLSRVKVMGKMDITDKRKPQDGRYKIRVGHKVADLRISSLPTMYGEKIVLRLLEQKGVGSMEGLGFSPLILGAFHDLLNNPQGMILVTGPTGSGKTSTLYSALCLLNDGTTNIVTLEDPIEYHMPGINQVQINTKGGITFASGLRSILRQDPDVILVGEIRDSETAEIAFNTAQTGHLVLTTLHTRGAVASVTRLLAMRIDPYLITSSILGILSQRLVRQLCPHCKVQTPLEEKLAEWLPEKARELPHRLFAPKGCSECRDTGFQGRFPIGEILVVNDSIRSLILKGRPDWEILAEAGKDGMKSTFEDGIDRVLQGLTTLKEVTRVVAPPHPPNTRGIKTVPLQWAREMRA